MNVHVIGTDDREHARPRHSPCISYNPTTDLARQATVRPSLSPTTPCHVTVKPRSTMDVELVGPTGRRHRLTKQPLRIRYQRTSDLLEAVADGNEKLARTRLPMRCTCAHCGS